MKITRMSSSEAFSLIVLTLVAAVVGLVTGVVAASFRLGLEAVAQLRYLLQEWGHDQPYGFWVYAAICVTAVVAAAMMVKYIEPAAEGSGIPRTEAVVEGRIPPGRSRILPVKFIGGLLAIGPGMMLGREGPLVQMGGNVAITINKIAKMDRQDLRVLVGAGAAAGLATAFNAPIAGGVFILEELSKRFDVRSSLATLTASATGFLTSSLIFGSETDFTMAILPEPDIWHFHWMVLVGVVCGLGGIAYNWYVMFCLHAADRLNRVPVELRAAVIALVIAWVGWTTPELVGGGANLTQQALFARGGITVALGILLIRFVLGPICYAAGTPGGLFAPMLVLGATLGQLVGLVASQLQPDASPPVSAMALIGMAAFFASSVRAPVTGLILATEMTGTVTFLPPMLGACAVAMLVATAARTEPLYEQLAHRSEQADRFRRVFEVVYQLPVDTAKTVSRGIRRVTHSGVKQNRTKARAQKLRQDSESNRPRRR